MHWRIERFIRNRRLHRAQTMERKLFILPDERPLVTFTFDDFPRSAFTNGMPVLDRHGVHGSFYVTMGMMDRDESSLDGTGFRPEDLRALVAGGHDLGCHTYSHLDCWKDPARAIAADIARNQTALAEVLPGHRFEHFAYPHTHATPTVKRFLSEQFAASRGGVPQINTGEVDLSLLGAFTLFSSRYDRDKVRALLAENAQRRGWLIYITHDVRAKPSPYGCTPEQLDEAISLAVNSGATVVSCQEALQLLGVLPAHGHETTGR